MLAKQILLHSPGPWDTPPADDDGRKMRRVVMCADHPVAYVEPDGMERGERDANAWLISAAPDLFEALHALVHEIEANGYTQEVIRLIRYARTLSG